MRKPYAIPEMYVNWETETLKSYTTSLSYMIIVMCQDRCVETPFDRHVLNNAYDDLSAMKAVLDTRTTTYTTKIMIDRMLETLKNELDAYDKREREGRLARKILNARRKLIQSEVL